jgi:hypothetical protein
VPELCGNQAGWNQIHGEHGLCLLRTHHTRAVQRAALAPAAA